MSSPSSGVPASRPENTVSSYHVEERRGPWHRIRTADSSPGAVFYYNAITATSTWHRPPVFTHHGKHSIDQRQSLPGTPWIRVRLHDGRTFYYHPPSRQSSWHAPSIPEEEENGDGDGDDVHNDDHTIDDNNNDNDIDNDNNDADDDELEFEVFDPETGDTTTMAAMQRRIDDGGMEEREQKKEKEEELKETSPTQEEGASKEEEKQEEDDRVQQFKQMLIDTGVRPFSDYKTELPKFMFDSRFKTLPVSDRVVVFNEFVRNQPEMMRQEKISRLRKASRAFRQLMDEAGITHRSRFSDLAREHGNDSRFRALEDDRARRRLFEERVKHRREEYQQHRTAVLQRLREQGITTHHSWEDIHSALRKDRLWRTLPLEDARSIVKAYQGRREEEETAATEAVRERRDREHNTLQKRRAEVQKELERRKQAEAIRDFKNLLAENIHSARKWEEVQDRLAKDPRFSGADRDAKLSDDQRRDLFAEHLHYLKKQQKNRYRQLLSETTKITMASKFEEYKPLLESRTPDNIDLDLNEKEELFSEHVMQLRNNAKKELQDLLRESEHETAVVNAQTPEYGQGFEEMKQVLQMDKRFRVWDGMESERDSILRHYLQNIKDRSRG